MKVRALKSFAGPLGSYAPGDEFVLPRGVDWLVAGMVEKVTPTVLGSKTDVYAVGKHLGFGYYELHRNGEPTGGRVGKGRKEAERQVEEMNNDHNRINRSGN